MALVFVYGSLKYNARGSEHSNYQRIKNLRGRRVARVALKEHKIYFMENGYGKGICCLDYSGNPMDVVFGELFTLPQESLEKLDGFEGHPNVYVREKVKVIRVIGGEAQELEAFVYRFNAPEGFLADHALPIPSGNYIEKDWIVDHSLGARYK